MLLRDIETPPYRATSGITRLFTPMQSPTTGATPVGTIAYEGPSMSNAFTPPTTVPLPVDSPPHMSGVTGELSNNGHGLLGSVESLFSSSDTPSIISTQMGDPSQSTSWLILAALAGVVVWTVFK